MSELTEAVLALPAKERAELVVQLIDSLETDSPSPAELAENQRAWEAETLRIAAEIDAGRMDLVPWEQARKQLFGKRR